MLSGLFCCLGFSGVIFLLLGRGRVFLFAVWAPAQTAKNKTRHSSNSKKNKHVPAPSERVVFLLFGRGRVFFCCLGGDVFFSCCLGGGVFIFLLFGQGACVFFSCCLGGCMFIFAVWARGVFYFLLFGRGTCSFFCCLGGGGGGGVVFFCFCCLGGDGSSLTYRSAWLVFKPTSTKKRVPGLGIVKLLVTVKRQESCMALTY